MKSVSSAKCFVAIGEEAHFERLGHLVDVVDAAEQGRHGDHGPCLRRDAFGVIHARQMVGRGDQHRGEIQQAEGELAGDDERAQGQDGDEPARARR